ncbi:MAG: c-type cytochrome, partial [Acidobacteriota bacterium]
MKNPSKLKLAVISMALTAALMALSVSSSSASATPAAFEDAAAIYAAKCAKCHGADGKGVEKYKKQGIEDFTDAKFQKGHTDAKIAAAINNGKGDFMPAWKGKLKPAEVTALVKYIR